MYEPRKTLSARQRPVLFVLVAVLIFVWYIDWRSPSARLLAVVIETNPPQTLSPIILHFLTVLGPQWKVVLYTLEKNWQMPPSQPFRRAVGDGTIEVRFLPSDADFSGSAKVNEFISGTWLWEQLQEASRVLMFQLDSILCTNSDLKVDDFSHYDFIGAPIAPQFGQGYNGGMSLRNPRLFLEIAKEETPTGWEDQWFYAMAQKRIGDGVRLPSVEVAKTFAVESIYYESPLGYHQPQRWQADNLSLIRARCPEISMLESRRIV